MTETSKETKDGRPGASMRYWLGATLKEARAAKGISREEVAALSDEDASTIGRFENGQSFTNVDERVVAYAELLGIEDARELWDRALAAWKRRGAVPTFGELSPARRAAQLALEAALRRRLHGVESPPARNTSRRPPDSGG